MICIIVCFYYTDRQHQLVKELLEKGYIDKYEESKYVNGEVNDKITDLELLAKLQTSESILGSRILRNKDDYERLKNKLMEFKK